MSPGLTPGLAGLRVPPVGVGFPSGRRENQVVCRRKEEETYRRESSQNKLKKKKGVLFNSVLKHSPLKNEEGYQGWEGRS